MFKAYLLLLTNWCRYFGWQLVHLAAPRPTQVLRNLVILLGVLPLLLVLLHIHWLGLWLDELLFHRYRHTPVHKPLFILGVPRSGTTFLQRTLSRDPQFTTTTLEECLLTPSICQRYLAAALKALFRPLTARLPNIKHRFLRRMESIHALGLQQPEEDFLLLLPTLSCFIQMVLFPAYPRVWRLADMERELPAGQRDLILQFYHRMLQRHLYFHGDKYLLSKNPSFTTLAAALKTHYPDATIITCVRSPEQTVPSQVSALKPAFDLLGQDVDDPAFRRRMRDTLARYYRAIEDNTQHPGRVLVVDREDLKNRLFACIDSIYRAGGYSMTPDLRAHYREQAQRNRTYRSHHRYAVAGGDNGIDFHYLWPLSGHSRLLSENEL